MPASCKVVYGRPISPTRTAHITEYICVSHRSPVKRGNGGLLAGSCWRVIGAPGPPYFWIRWCNGSTEIGKRISKPGVLGVTMPHAIPDGVTIGITWQGTVALLAERLALLRPWREVGIATAPLLQAYGRSNLANAYSILYEVTGDDRWALRASELFGNLSSLFTRNEYLQAWAITQLSLGNLYTGRYERSGDDAHARQADEHYRAALEEYRREVAPAGVVIGEAVRTVRLKIKQDYP